MNNYITNFRGELKKTAVQTLENYRTRVSLEFSLYNSVQATAKKLGTEFVHFVIEFAD